MIQNIVLIGAGKLATQLGTNLVQNGFNIRQVYSKTIANAEVLAEKLGAYYTNDLNNIQLNSDLYIIAVSDSVLAEVINSMPLIEGIVAHTAGSMPSSILERFDNHGTFYPFQTFSKEKSISFKDIPCLIEGNNSDTEKQLMDTAQKISDRATICSSEERKKIHLAAVFACNFSNHLYKTAFELLESNNIDPKVIKPLILETAEKVMQMSPKEAQTGPASRNDTNILEMHKKMLGDDDELKNIYSLFSERITKENS